MRRALDILNAFSHRVPDLSITELSNQLGFHKSIVSRLVSTLRESRLIEQDPVTRRVRIGVGAFQLGTLFVNQQPLYRLAVPHVSALVEKTHHSSHLAVLDDCSMLVVATVESPQALRVILRVGERRYLHASAGGKIFLAFGPSGLLETIGRDPALVPVTPRTITSLGTLRREVVRVRREGVAWNFEEHTAGAGGVAAPVLDAAGKIAAAVCLVFPVSVVRNDDRPGLATAVRECAAGISGALGWNALVPAGSIDPITDTGRSRRTARRRV